METEIKDGPRPNFLKSAVAKIRALAVANKTALTVVGVAAVLIAADYFFRAGGGTNHYAQGIADMQAGKHDAAVASFSRALEINPADPASRFGLGWAYQAKGLNEDAIRQYDMAAAAGTDTLSLTYFNSGVIHMQNKLLDQAAAAYHRAMEINPQSVGAVYNLGFVYSDKGQPELALQQFLRAAQLNPKYALAHYNAGLIAERLGRKDEAKKYYNLAVSADPNLGAARDRLRALGN